MEALKKGKKGRQICGECTENTGCNAITFKQQRDILKAIDVPKYRCFFIFCCCSGMRVCEALSVKTKNIDHKKRVIRIDMPDTKTKKHKRSVPFLPELFAGMDMSGKFLFSDITDGASSQYFCCLYKTLGYELSRHSTRHTFISICRHVGIDENLVREWAGHTDLKMTVNTYTHTLTKGSSPMLAYIKKLKKSLKL